MICENKLSLSFFDTCTVLGLIKGMNRHTPHLCSIHQIDTLSSLYPAKYQKKDINQVWLQAALRSPLGSPTPEHG
jgi:hypothetical protein